MTLDNPRLNVLPPSPPSNRAAEKLNHLQNTLMSMTWVWAVDEVGAAMAHQLHAPLTALLLYLHKIKEKDEHSTGAEAVPDSIGEMAGKALREMERVCNIMERTWHTFDAPVDAGTSGGRGRTAINWLTRTGRAKGGGASPAPDRPGQTFLTLRECEVLALITEGACNREGAHRLGISKRTFEVHRAHIMKKLGARNAADLVRMTLSETR